MTLTLIDHAYHRNGISGVPFDVVRFHDPQAGPMLGVVFREPGCVAVLNLDRLAAGDIAFGSNSWRGDRYEPTLRRLVAATPGQDPDQEDGRRAVVGLLAAALDWCAATGEPLEALLVEAQAATDDAAAIDGRDPA